MRYFNGFSLKNEQELFSNYLIKSDFTVGGFSYGAIKAFEYALKTKSRTDKLQLFSPANFANRNTEFKKLQLIHYRRDRRLYIKNFLQIATSPKKIDMSKYIASSNVDELKELLDYVWDVEKLKALQKKGVKIEVYLGEYDKIVNPEQNYNFFRKFATVYYIKNVGHILK